MTINAQNVPASPSSGKLVLVRHAESVWNVAGKWTGRADVHLTEKGHHDSRLAGEALQDIKFDLAYCSEQIRTGETLQDLLQAAHQAHIQPEACAALNERDYGDYTGMNKWEALERLGRDKFDKIRRDWDYPIPNGETMKVVYDRLVPFYQNLIVPQLLAGKTIVVVSHGNTLRTLIKHLEGISDADIAAVEMPFDQLLIFTVTSQGLAASKERRTIKITRTHA